MMPKMIAMDMIAESVLEINSNDVPEIKNWLVGKEYKMELTVQMTESEMEENGVICSEFKIKKVKVL